MKLHQYILTTGKPKRELNTRASFLVVDHYLKGIDQSRNRWKKDKQQYKVNWNKNDQPQVSSPISYTKIANHLRTEKSFNPDVFNLPPMMCFWMDHSLDMKIDVHMTDHTGTLGLRSGVPQQQFGDNYPIDLNLQREGHLFTSFQPQLINRIIFQRKRLIEHSNQSLSDEWVFDLRTLISDTISLLDITLNSLYIKAEYDPLPTWNFDLEILGSRHGRRVSDKLKWVYQISGNFLNLEPERESLESLRQLRNHLMHFDPPSLIITLEEATLWLNQVIDIAVILVKIREALGIELSSGLVNLLIQEEAKFNPKDIGRKRSPFTNSYSEGYKMSTWK